MKELRLSVVERKNGTFWIVANDIDFELLRTSDGENEYLEVFPHDFPFRPIKLKTCDVSMDLLETMIAQELAEYTSKRVKL